MGGTNRTTCVRAMLLAVLGGLAVASPVSAGVRSPLQGTGDFQFLADLPVFHADDGRPRLDLVVRVDHEELRPEVTGSARWTRDVAVTLKLARQGVVAVDTLQSFRVLGQAGFERSAGAVRYDLLEISVVAPPGRWAATVDLVTLDAKAQRARATGVLEVPVWPDGVPVVSDPEFRLRTHDGSLPHPERLYGVLQDTLVAYVELRGAAPGERLELGVEVVDVEFGSMDRRTVELAPRTDPAASLVSVPLLTLPDGAYVLRLSPTWTDGPVSESEFVVSWELERTLQGRDDVMVEAELVLPPDELEAFRRMSRPVQTQVMERFWFEHDPTPGTPRNELHDRFLERVAYAARFYGEYQRPGPLTDRGRIYIAYGPPAIVDVEVIPTDRRDLEDAIEQVHDAFAIDIAGTNIRGPDDPRPTDQTSAGDAAERDRRRNAARIGQEGSFELWRYNSVGDPLFEDTTLWGEDIDLRFLFVDRDGIGVYELDYTNAETHH